MTNEQIEKYLSGLCTEEEAAGIQKFLTEHPEHTYLQEEWDCADPLTALQGNQTQAMYDTISAAIIPDAKSKFGSAWKWGAAASLVTAVLVVFFLVKHENENSTVLAEQTVKADTSLVVKENTDEKDMELLLSDGSRIVLSPKTSVKFHGRFNAYTKREVYINGKANFEVAKNRNKPFVVYSRNISTTVLGTVFTIDAPAGRKEVTVKLFEGKVWVALTEPQYRKPGNDFYLVPGQQLDFNTITRSGRLHAFAVKHNKTQTRKADDMRSVDAEDNGSSFMFNNQTLADVLDQLSRMYHIKIEYSKTDLGNIYFIGKIDKEDSLDKIINDIAVLNRLLVKKKNGVYILRKNK